MVLISQDNNFVLNIMLKFCSIEGCPRSCIWRNMLFMKVSRGKLWWVNIAYRLQAHSAAHALSLPQAAPEVLPSWLQGLAMPCGGAVGAGQDWHGAALALPRSVAFFRDEIMEVSYQFLQRFTEHNIADRYVCSI